MCWTVYIIHAAEPSQVTSKLLGIGSTTNTFAAPTEALQEYRENITYDANGNILTYKRNGNAARLEMDDMVYTYKPNTNQLDKVVDNAPDVVDADYPKYNDIKRMQPNGSDGQQDGNYTYDEIGNLIADKSERITKIEWTVYGKISRIEKEDGTPAIHMLMMHQATGLPNKKAQKLLIM